MTIILISHHQHQHQHQHQQQYQQQEAADASPRGVQQQPKRVSPAVDATSTMSDLNPHATAFYPSSSSSNRGSSSATGSNMTGSNEHPATSSTGGRRGRGDGKGRGRGQGRGRGKSRQGRGRGKGRGGAKGGGNEETTAPRQQHQRSSTTPSTHNHTNTNTNTSTSTNAKRSRRRGRQANGSATQDDSATPTPSRHTQSSSSAANGRRPRRDGNRKGPRSQGSNSQARPSNDDDGVQESATEPKPRSMQQQQQQDQKQAPAPASSLLIEDNEPIPLAEFENMTTAIEMAKDLMDETYECMICLDVIKRSAPLWHCGSCFRILHLRCAKEWGKSCSSMNENKAIQWRCPSCQTDQFSLPRVSKCFCRKHTTRPWVQQGPPPHTCGEVCNKRLVYRGQKCVHRCTAICHPGPCAPCDAIVMRTCHCGKQKMSTRCADQTVISCGKVCEKKLNCGVHRCKEVCHDGPCTACPLIVKRRCFCGKHTSAASCGTAESKQLRYSCAEPCGKPLACGVHACAQPCHKGECKPCPRSPEVVKTCPCGRMPLSIFSAAKQRASCTDPIPVCMNICDKERPCGHPCEAPCHDSECPPCTHAIQMPCVCGFKTQEVLCKDFVSAPESADSVFRCTRVCDQQLNCRRHKCQQKCCPGRTLAGVYFEGHECPRECGRQLSCGCVCDHPCHAGRCPPCGKLIREPLTCECGKTSIPPPVPCGFPRPDCQHLCSRKHKCDHPVTHKCHYNEECEPCTVLVEKPCHCGAEKIIRPCFASRSACKNKCKALLGCGKHRCQVFCHKGSCVDAFRASLPALKAKDALRGLSIVKEVDADGEQVNVLKAGTPCFLKCGEVRPCGHQCVVRCHVGSPCPPVPCRLKVKRSCRCGVRTEVVKCDYGNPLKAEAFQQVLDHPDTANAGATTSEQLPLECTAECVKYKQNLELSKALGIQDADLSADIKTTYDDELVEKARRNMTLIRQLEAAMDKYTTQPTKSECRLKVMKSDARAIAHALAEIYGFASESQDPEPYRSVVLFHTPLRKARIPNPKLSHVALYGYVAVKPTKMAAKPALVESSTRVAPAPWMLKGSSGKTQGTKWDIFGDEASEKEVTSAANKHSSSNATSSSGTQTTKGTTQAEEADAPDETQQTRESASEAVTPAEVEDGEASEAEAEAEDEDEVEAEVEDREASTGDWELELSLSRDSDNVGQDFSS